MADNVPISAGSGTTIATEDVGGVHYQRVIASPEAHAAFRGRCTTFRTPGRAGTTGQKLFSIHNALASPVIVTINHIIVDIFQTVAKAATVAPPIIRVHRVTILPTAGTALSKVAKDTALTSSSSVTVLGDASADGTSSVVTLTATIPADRVLAQEVAPRLLTAAGYELQDRADLLQNRDILLRPLEGIVVELVYTLATQNPTTDMWFVTCDWFEHT